MVLNNGIKIPPLQEDINLGLCFPGSWWTKADILALSGDQSVIRHNLLMVVSVSRWEDINFMIQDANFRLGDATLMSLAKSNL